MTPGSEPCWVVVSQSSDRKSTRLNSSHRCISYAVFCLKKKIRSDARPHTPVLAVCAKVALRFAVNAPVAGDVQYRCLAGLDRDRDARWLWSDRIEQLLL